MTRILTSVVAVTVSLSVIALLPTAASGDFGRVLNMKHSSFCLDSTNNEAYDGGRVIIWTCHGGDGNWQKWTALGLGNGYHQVRSEWDGRCLDINPGQNWAGARVYRWRCWEWWDSRVQYQSWRFESDGTIRSMTGAWCVHTVPTGPYDGAPVYKWSCDQGLHSRWYSSEIFTAG
jgi:hypothetical protein